MPALTITAIACLLDLERKDVYRLIATHGIPHAPRQPIDVNELIQRGIVSRARVEAFLHEAAERQARQTSRVMLRHLYETVPLALEALRASLARVEQQLRRLERSLPPPDTAEQGQEEPRR